MVALLPLKPRVNSAASVQAEKLARGCTRAVYGSRGADRLGPPAPINGKTDMAIFHANAPPETMAAALLENYQELAQTLSHLARAFADLSLRERHDLDEQLEDHM